MTQQQDKTLFENQQMEYMPWVRNNLRAKAQLKRQADLVASQGALIGKQCFIAEGAKVFCQSFRMGIDSSIAADTLIRGDFEMGSGSRVNPFCQISGRVKLGDLVRP